MKSCRKKSIFSKVTLSIILLVLLIVSPMAGYAEDAGIENTTSDMNDSTSANSNNFAELDASSSSDKISIVIQLRNITKTVGDPDPLPGVVLISGSLLPGDTLASLPLIYGRKAGETVGNYSTWYVYSGNTYNVTIVQGTLTIKAGRVPR